MNDIIMEKILGNDYKKIEDNYYNVFINYINYWIKYDKTHEEIDKMWLQNLSDDESADTLFSLFIPLKTVVRHISKKHIIISKEKLKKSFKKLKTYDEQIKYLSKLLPKCEIVDLLQEFACLASSRNNVITVPRYLPEGETKSINQYRGMCYFDQMPVMLHCILKGKITGKENRFSKYFKNTLEIENWINKNKLYRLFNTDKKEIKLSGIKELDNYGIKDIGLKITKKDYIFYHEFDIERLKRILKNYIEILKIQ